MRRSFEGAGGPATSIFAGVSGVEDDPKIAPSAFEITAAAVSTPGAVSGLSIHAWSFSLAFGSTDRSTVASVGKIGSAAMTFGSGVS